MAGTPLPRKLRWSSALGASRDRRSRRSLHRCSELLRERYGLPRAYELRHDPPRDLPCLSLDLQASIPAGLTATYQRVLDFHVAEAKRVDETFPVTAHYHRCSHYGEGCRSSEAPSFTAAEVNPFGLTIETRRPAECEDVRMSIPILSDATFAVTRTPVRVELSRCGPLPSRSEQKTFNCGQQFATATVT